MSRRKQVALGLVRQAAVFSALASSETPMTEYELRRIPRIDRLYPMWHNNAIRGTLRQLHQRGLVHEHRPLGAYGAKAVGARRFRGREHRTYRPL